MVGCLPQWSKQLHFGESMKLPQWSKFISALLYSMLCLCTAHDMHSARSVASSFKDGIVKSIRTVSPAVLFNMKRVEARTVNRGSFVDGALLHPKWRHEVQSGGIYVADNFLPKPTLQALQQDIHKANEEGRFEASGLSNSAKGGKQGFNSKNDRAVCPVLGSSGYRSEILELVKDDYLSKLQGEIARELNRPTLVDDRLGHELYYSRSPSGSYLKRHVDERHPELSKRGYRDASRRSISFLLYLSEVKGGQLRVFTQKGSKSQPVGGSFDNCMQVAWLIDREDGTSKQIFLDSWRDNLPVCELFCVQTQDYGRNTLARETISVPFDMGSSGTKTMMNNLNQVLLPQYRDHRYLVAPIEELDAELPPNARVLDVEPRANRVVIFDSVMLPHQVQITDSGTRLALAGWFHEASPPIPEPFAI